MIKNPTLSPLYTLGNLRTLDHWVNDHEIYLHLFYSEQRGVLSHVTHSAQNRVRNQVGIGEHTHISFCPPVSPKVAPSTVGLPSNPVNNKTFSLWTDLRPRRGNLPWMANWVNLNTVKCSGDHLSEVVAPKEGLPSPSHLRNKASGNPWRITISPPGRNLLCSPPFLPTGGQAPPPRRIEHCLH